MAKTIMLTAVLAAGLAASPAMADRNTARYTSVTVFGDSLVDAGNFYIATNETQPDPALGYFKNRFTNGYDYPDLLSIALFGTPTTPSFLGGNNYGIAGARVIDVNDGIPDLAAQINMFQLTGEAVDPNGLYILNFGANDVFAAKGVFDDAGGIGAYADTSAYLQAAATQYVAGVQALADMGVRNILMTDFPLAGDAYTIEANGYLTAALANLTLSPGTDFMFYSLSDFNTRVLTDPAAFNLPVQRTDTFCIAAGAQANGCKGIFSFDGIHPTAAVQLAGYKELNALFGLTAFQPVPESHSWALMILGFAAVGGAMRYRRRTVTVAYA